VCVCRVVAVASIADTLAENRMWEATSWIQQSC
jgi:hypothetical protein